MTKTKWTPEARAAFGEKVKAMWAAKRAAKAEEPENPNPLRGEDAILPAEPVAVEVKKTKSNHHDHPPNHFPKDRIAPVIIGTLQELDLDELTYQETGELLNALSAATTKLAVARRQKQEQLEAGTHRAPCSTCGKMIDISKSGGFQILTVRDEHFMPKNIYLCSVECLLARNMPSHAKQTAKEKKENRA